MVRTTEYNHSFRPKLEKYMGRYVENIDYRIQRRLEEHMHNNAVFLWESDSDSDIVGEPAGSLQTPRIVSIPAHKKKFMKSKQRDTYLIEYKDKEQNKAVEVDEYVSPNIKNKICYTDQHSSKPLVNKPLNMAIEQEKPYESNQGDYDSHKFIDCEVQTPDNTYDRKSKLVHQTTNSFASKGSQTKSNEYEDLEKKRSQSASNPKTVAKNSSDLGRKSVSLTEKKQTSGRDILISEKTAKPPFVPYGCQDRELTTGSKQTHNIRASSAVREPALRAYKRRQLEIKRHEEELRSPAVSYRRQQNTIKNHFDEAVKRATASWVSEYQQSFLPYNRQEYTRGAAATMPRRPKTPTTGNRLISTA